ncbi:MAG: hypothetical protein U1E98_00055 [Moraxella osloensis]
MGKSERIAKLAAFIATQIGEDVEQTARHCCQQILPVPLRVSFRELQGVAGTYYARFKPRARSSGGGNRRAISAKI